MLKYILIIVSLLTSLVKGGEDLKAAAENLKVHCLLHGGTIDPTELGNYPFFNCTDTPETEEECVIKGGKFGEFCLKKAKCVAFPGRCFVDLPKEMITPATEKVLETSFNEYTKMSEMADKLKKQK